jgi:hypothetical protein
LSQCKKESTTAGASTEGALAVVAGRPVTGEDLIEEASWRMANNQAVPPAPELLKEMTRRLAMVERARKAGLADEPGTRRRIESLLIARLREQELDAALAKIEITPEEIAAGYEARREELSRKGLDRFAILFQAADARMSEARRAESRERLEAALALADANPAAGGRGPAASGFGAIAAEHSEDQSSRYRGGDIGWIESDAKETRWPAAVLEAGRALEKGKRSGVLEGPDGYYAIMKTDSRPGGVRPLEEVSENIRQTLLREKRRVLEESFVNQAVQASQVEINAEAAARIQLPASTPPAPAAPELSPP